MEILRYSNYRKNTLFRTATQLVSLCYDMTIQLDFLSIIGTQQIMQTYTLKLM